MGTVANALKPLKACNDDDQSCACNHDTLIEVNQCEQCFFTQLIKENRPMPGGDIRAGGKTALAGTHSDKICFRLLC
jgi:hypothetical protein